MAAFQVGDRIKIKDEYVKHLKEHSRYGVIIEISSWIYVKMDDCKCGYHDVTDESKESCCIGFREKVLDKDHTHSKEYIEGADALKRWLES